MTDSHQPPILTVRDLSVSFRQGQGHVDAVRQVSFDLHKGETLALVGESGSGKSVTAHALTRLLPEKTTQYADGRVDFEDQDLLKISEPELRKIRGNRIAMIFQEPMTALNPLHTVAKQIGETLALHQGMDKKAIRDRTLELLHLVGIPAPEEKINSYPHE